MTVNRRFSFTSDKQITAMTIQGTSPYLWRAFALDSNSQCIVEKSFIYSPDQIYFSIAKDVNEVVAMTANTSKVFLAYDDDTLFGEILSVSNPITSTTSISIPMGATEVPVDIQVDGTDLWFLTPGVASGMNAQLWKYTTSGAFSEMIDLTKSGLTVTDAQTMAVDTSGDIWLVTNTSPAKIIRVYPVTGGWDFDETIIT